MTRKSASKNDKRHEPIGLVPLALGIGEGSELQAPMAIVTMGGILVATFLTLVVTPALYIGTEELAERFRKKKAVTQPSS